MSCNLIQVYRPLAGLNYDSVAIGTLVNGGYYAGKMNIDGMIYAILAAPNSYSTPGKNTKVDTSTDGAIAQSTYDGWTTCQTFNDANHPAIQWARSLTINGKNDWYIPSRDELELMYRSLGLNASGNVSTNRGPQGQLGDVAGPIGDGDNQHSVPIGQPYVITKKLANSSTPVQLNITVCLSCTESTPAPAQVWGQFTGSGGGTSVGQQDTWGKSTTAGNGNFFHHPIRRELIGPA